jgi:hypothetical protein
MGGEIFSQKTAQKIPRVEMIGLSIEWRADQGTGVKRNRSALTLIPLTFNV